MAGSSNFLQWNPGQANQENDPAYAADSQRLGGAPNGVLFPSSTGNKLFYQLSTFIAAFAQSLANKNYNVSDSSISTLQSVLANLVTFNDLKANLASVSFSTTPAFNAASTNGFDFVMAANVSSSTITGQQVGQTLTFIITQGGASYTFSPPSNINGWITINPVPGSVTIQSFIVKADGTIWPIETEINLILAAIAALQANSITKGQFTTGSGSLGFGAQATFDTGISVSSTALVSASVLSGSINPILTYMITTQGGTIKCVISNTSSSNQNYTPLTYNYGIQ